ncbi:hypothetical protein BC835DRAFT_1039478 [Cytidiella melzeri]|nr:hypothetical protein BC835DRAFT_1039478 [Cytidiella melzeri]
MYMSAQYRLQHDFAGKRTEKVLESYPTPTTNFWPYLRFRQRETADRKAAYMRSFLADAFQQHTGCPPETAVSEWLWGSPDDDRQISIALRFLLTRLWFTVSIGGARNDDWLHGSIVSAKEVVAGEIWGVSFSLSNKKSSSLGRVSTVYVLEATCEVIGHTLPPLPQDNEDQEANTLALRVDWSSYLSKCMQAVDLQPVSLLSQLKWAHHAEYDRGLSRLWLTRISKEGEAGIQKRRVAERYVLACVVANSVSGTWMSTVDMAQEFAGMPSRYGLSTSRTHAQDTVSLYLPAHHHVESVHFATSAGVPLHPALAVIQTPSREHFILKDNGMEVGCEEDGVLSLWMELLGCDSKGLTT